MTSQVSGADRPWNEPVPESGDQALRDVFSRLAGGVAVLATVDPVGRDCAITVTAVSAVSLNPPLLLVCVRSGSFIHDAMETASGWSLTFLSAGQEPLARYTARSHRPGDRDDFSPWAVERGAASQALIFTAGVGAVECVPWHQFEAGDHTVFVGQVAAIHQGVVDEPPLVYVDRHYRSVDG